MDQTATRKYIAEAIGTFVLVFGGVGSAVLAGKVIGNSGVALAFGLALLAMVYAIGPISGCHVNPAVTLGLLLGRKINSRDAVGYVIAQIIGAIIAAGLLLIIAKGDRAATTRPRRALAPTATTPTHPGTMVWAPHS